MYLKVKNKKIEIQTLNTFWERFRSLKFVFEPLDYGICFIKKRFKNTYFFCQKVDVVLTDQNHTILYLYQGLNTEKILFPKKNVYYTYFLPLNTVKFLKLGEQLPLFQKEDIDQKKATSSK